MLQSSMYSILRCGSDGCGAVEGAVNANDEESDADGLVLRYPAVRARQPRQMKSLSTWLRQTRIRSR